MADKVQSYLDEVEEQLQHMQMVMTDILNMYNYANEQVTYRRSRFDIQKMLLLIVEQTALISRRQIALETENHSCIVHAHRARTKQVLINILNNAIKYSDPDTSVTVRVTSSDTEVQIAVTDTGRGIKKEDIPKIFKQSYRTRHEGAVSSGDSSGIGLFLCDRIMQEQEGRIEVESTFGEGSTFTCVFKRAESS